ncbi:MAG: lipid-binding protein [Sphingobacteriales bacterium]
MKYKQLFFSFLFLSIQLISFSQQSWNLKKENDGIKVYTRSVEGSKFNEIKVECSISGTLSQLAALLLDVEDHVNWVYSCRSSLLEKKITDTHIIYYTEVNAPWPLTNRDLYIDLDITQDSITKMMTVVATGLPNYLPPHGKLIRVPLSKAIWHIKAIDKTLLQIEYNVQVNTGGSAPAWMVNMFSTKGPYESFKNLMGRMLLPDYRQSKFRAIRN